MTIIHQNDIGTIIKLTPSDQDDLTVGIDPRIDYIKPSGETGSWTATIETGDIATGEIQYITQSGDIDEIGIWTIQGFINLGAWQGSSTISTFEVKQKI
jgi:hypothetical protein